LTAMLAPAVVPKTRGAASVYESNQQTTVRWDTNRTIADGVISTNATTKIHVQRFHNAPIHGKNSRPLGIRIPISYQSNEVNRKGWIVAI
jgi:hypothetical protein